MPESTSKVRSCWLVLTALFEGEDLVLMLRLEQSLGSGQGRRQMWTKTTENKT